MRPGSAGIVVLGMSASFILILVVMIVWLRPGQRERPAVRTAQAAPSKQEPRGPEQPVPSRKRTPTQASTTQPDPALITKTPSAGVPEQEAPKRVIPIPGPLPEPQQTVYWKLQQERREVRLLREEMNARLKEKKQQRAEQIARLADSCEELKTEEAAQILLELDNDTLREILIRMDPEAAIRIAALLDGLGRKEALTYVKGSL